MSHPRSAVRNQKVAFYFSLVVFLGAIARRTLQLAFESSGDSVGARQFSYHPTVIGFLPVFALCWVVSVTLLGNSVRECGRMTTYGLLSLTMLVITAAPLAVVVIRIYWQFFVSS